MVPDVSHYLISLHALKNHVIQLFKSNLMPGVPGLFKHATITVVELNHQELHFEAQLELYLAFSCVLKHRGFSFWGLLTQRMWFYGLFN